MRAVIASVAYVALADDSRMLFSTGVRAPSTMSRAQDVAVYDELVVPMEVPQLVQPVSYAEPAVNQGDLSWVLPGMAILAVGAVAGNLVAGRSTGSDASVDEALEQDLEAALDEAQVLTLAGPLPESKIAMLFSGGKKAAPKGKGKVAPKPKAKPKAVAKPRGKAAPKKSGSGPNLQPAASTIPALRDLFSLSAVGGAQGNTLR
jgi:hypothetical protein